MYIVDAFGADGYFRAIEEIKLDLLEIMGKGYVIEHCISFFQKENRQKTYQYYVTDLLCGIARKQGLNISERFRDLVEPKRLRVILRKSYRTLKINWEGVKNREFDGVIRQNRC